MPGDGVVIRCSGESLTLLPDRAVYWPRRATLLVADVHLGKGAVFRRAGLAVPTGSSADDVTRLADLCVRTGARRLIVLGDLVHGAAHPDEPALRALAAWRGAHPELALIAVRGNHDRHAVGALDAWVDWRADPLIDGSLVLRHDPQPHPAGTVLAGHLHPVMRLPDGLRVPVFWHRPGTLVLPSFGRFTGGHRIQLVPDEAAYAAGERAVVPLSPLPVEPESCPPPCMS